MIKDHLQSIAAVQDAISDLKDVIALLPDSDLKYQLAVQIGRMEATADALTDRTADIYDGMLSFAMAVSI